MRLLSRIVFGDYFNYQKTFDGDMKDSTKRLLKLLTIKDVKVTFPQRGIVVTWDERSNKFQFLGRLTEKDGKTKLNGEFGLEAIKTIPFLIWLSFWIFGSILWELGIIDFYRKGDDIGFLMFLAIGLIMMLAFLVKANRKAREIIEAIDEL